MSIGHWRERRRRTERTRPWPSYARSNWMLGRGMDPEYEAARDGFHLEFDEFAPGYRVAFLHRYGNDRAYRAPSLHQIREAYERFQAGRSDFY